MRKLNRSGLKAAALEAPPLAIDDAYFSRRVGGLGGGASQRLRRVLDKAGPRDPNLQPATLLPSLQLYAPSLQPCAPGLQPHVYLACNPMCTRPATPCTQAGLLDGAGKLTEDPRGSAWREAVRAA